MKDGDFSIDQRNYGCENLLIKVSQITIDEIKITMGWKDDFSRAEKPQA